VTNIPRISLTTAASVSLITYRTPEPSRSSSTSRSVFRSKRVRWAGREASAASKELTDLKNFSYLFIANAGKFDRDGNLVECEYDTAVMFDEGYDKLAGSLFSVHLCSA